MYCLTSSLVAVLALVSNLGVRAQNMAFLSHDSKYDNANLPLDQVTCSDLQGNDPNDNTLGSLPNFPYVAGVFFVSSYNTSQCGSCYAVTYENNTVNILVVDASDHEFAVSKAAMDAITKNYEVEQDGVMVTVDRVDPSDCGMPSSD